MSAQGERMVRIRARHTEHLAGSPAAAGERVLLEVGVPEDVATALGWTRLFDAVGRLARSLEGTLGLELNVFEAYPPGRAFDRATRAKRERSDWRAGRVADLTDAGKSGREIADILAGEEGLPADQRLTVRQIYGLRRQTRERERAFEAWARGVGTDRTD